MRLNGLALLVERGVELVDAPLLTRYRRAVVLGALREDVSYLPGLGRVVEHLSLSHFHRRGPGGFVPLWPGPRWKSERYLARAVRAHRRGRTAAGFVDLGRAAHLLADMACPVHVARELHDTDAFEWYVEAHRDELAALPVPPPPRAASASQLIDSLAGFTSGFPADPTQSVPGRWLARRGWLRRVPPAEVRRAARAIVPVAAAHMAALFGLYLGRIGQVAAAS